MNAMRTIKKRMLQYQAYSSGKHHHSIKLSRLKVKSQIDPTKQTKKWGSIRRRIKKWRVRNA